jgi:hypothetical protein
VPVSSPPIEASEQRLYLGRRLRRPQLIPARAWFTTHRVAVLVLLALAFAFYAWTAATSLPFSFSPSNEDIYNQLATAFLHLHTYLPIAVPAGLRHASDPWNPAVNAPYQIANPAIHDLALYRGRLYSPWGPTPLILFIPFRITGLKMSESFAVVAFAFTGLVLAVVLLHRLIRRFLPRTPRWLLLLATGGLALTNVEPFMLRRPAQYEVAISCGYCFLMAGLLLAFTAAVADRHRGWWLGLSSLCLGLAVGARLSLAPACLVPLVVAVYLIRKRGDGRWRQLVAAALGPVIACAVLLAAYNVVRFGSAGNFGEAYQLAGLDQHTMPADRLAYVPPGMFSYLLMPFRVTLAFPHVALVTTGDYPGPFPALYSGAPGGWPAEPAGGLFPTMPITLLLLVLPVLWSRVRAGGRDAGERAAIITAISGSVLGLAIMFLLAYALWGTTQRYEVDYATIFLLASFLVWAVLLERRRRGTRGRRAIAILGIVLVTIGCMVGTAVSFTGYDPLSISHPGTFDTLEDITSPFATLATMIAGRPVIARVAGAVEAATPNQNSFAMVGAGNSIAWLGVGEPVLTVVIDSPGSEHTYLRAYTKLGTGAPPASKLRLDVTSPGRAPLAIAFPPAGPLRMPITLHWGLNRINIALTGQSGGPPDELYLANVNLG